MSRLLKALLSAAAVYLSYLADRRIREEERERRLQEAGQAGAAATSGTGVASPAGGSSTASGTATSDAADQGSEQGSSGTAPGVHPEKPLPLDAGKPKGTTSKLGGIWKVLKDSVSSWVDDYASSMGAAIAYYTVFSLAPLLLIVISVAGLVFGNDAAQGAIFGQLRGLLGDEGAAAVQGLLKSVNVSGNGVLGTIVSLVLLVVGATTVFGELQNSLDRIWRSPAPKESSGIWNLLRTRLLSFGLILGLGFLLLASLVVSAALGALAQWWAPLFGGWEWVARAANFLVGFGLITVMFAMIYKWMPRADVAWHDVWIGAAVTSLLFAIGKFAIGLYIGKSGVASGFGAASSIVVLLVWVYYSAQIFLIGAEFTWVFAHEYGSRRADSSKPGGSVAQQGSAPSARSSAAVPQG